MRRLAVILVVLAGLGAAAAPASSDRSARPTGCLAPHFRGVSYTFPLTFRTAWFRVGKPLGAVSVVTVCKDYGTPNDPPRVEGRTVRVFQLKGFKPTVALSAGGSSRQLLIRSSTRCVPDVLIESALLRCLRRIR
jgi:hypothetical protein